MHPIRQQKRVSTPPPILPLETVAHLEELRSSSHRLRDWMKRSRETTYEHLEDIMQVYDKVSELKERVLALLTACAEFRAAKEQYMPHLKSLMGLSIDELIHAKIVEEGTTYDFSSWYFCFRNKGQLLDKVEIDMSRVRSVIQRIQDSIHASLMKICNPFGEMTIDRMKEQVKAFYFQEDDISDERLDSIFSLAIHLGTNKAQMTDWEKTLGVYTIDVLEAEGTIRNAPSVPLDDVKQVVSKFIALHSSGKDASHGDSS